MRAATSTSRWQAHVWTMFDVRKLMLRPLPSRMSWAMIDYEGTITLYIGRGWLGVNVFLMRAIGWDSKARGSCHDSLTRDRHPRPDRFYEISQSSGKLAVRLIDKSERRMRMAREESGWRAPVRQKAVGRTSTRPFSAPMQPPSPFRTDEPLIPPHITPYIIHNSRS